MRATLEQLKAMSPRELGRIWEDGGRFPFDRASCGGCLTLHAWRNCHSEITKQLFALEPGIEAWSGEKLNGNLHKHLEELYALRLFYDSLYPQTAEVKAEQLPQTETVAVRA